MRLGTILSLSLLIITFQVSNIFAQVGSDSPSYDERVQKLLRALDIEYTLDSGGNFKVDFDLGNGRSQRVLIWSNTNTYRNLEIREIWSIGYKSSSNTIPSVVANKLLEDTFSKKLGAWTKADEYAIFVVKISADTDSETLFSVLKIAVETADEMEEKLTGTRDEY